MKDNEILACYPTVCDCGAYSRLYVELDLSESAFASFETKVRHGTRIFVPSFPREFDRATVIGVGPKYNRAQIIEDEKLLEGPPETIWIALDAENGNVSHFDRKEKAFKEGLDFWIIDE